MNATTQPQQTQGFPAKAAHFMSTFGHWLAPLPILAHVLLAKVHELTPELSGSLQILTLTMGAGWVAGILHSAIVNKALVALQATQSGANNVSQIATALSQAISGARSQIDSQTQTTTKGSGT